MSKHHISAVIFTALARILIAPILVLGYAYLFGHSYSAGQMTAAVSLGIVGMVMALIAAFEWSKL